MGQLALCKQQVAQAREQADQGREAQALITLGKVHQEKGRKKLALDAWSSASSLLHAQGRDRELAELYTSMAGTCLHMGWTSRGCQYYRYACDLHRKLGDMPEVGRLYVQIGTLASWDIEDSKLSFQLARTVFRRLSDTIWEARSYLIQARTFWLRHYQKEALGYLRYGQELLARLPDESEADWLDDLSFASQLQVYFGKSSRSELDYSQTVEASTQAYNEASGEAEAIRLQSKEYHRDRLPEIERLGLLRHDIGRSEAEALPAQALIERHGYRKAAISAYEEALPALRRSHNRLAEAITAGTVALLRIALRERAAWSAPTIELYQEAHHDALGLGRTYFNEAIHHLLSGEAHADSALAYLRRAEELLVAAQATQDVLRRVRQTRVALKRQLGSSAYAKARKSALEIYERIRESSGMVPLYLAVAPGEYDDPLKTGTPIGEAENVLEALTQVLTLLLDEVRRAHPREITVAARGQSVLVEGITTGRSLAGHSEPPSPTDAERVLLVRLLEMQGPLEEDPYHWRPLVAPTRDGYQPGVLPLSRAGLEKLLLDYLDQHYGELSDGRAIEVVDEGEQRVCWLCCFEGH